MASTSTDLVPRSLRKRKTIQARAGPSKISKPAVPTISPCFPTPSQQNSCSDFDQEQLVSLVTCAITECSISQDFKIRIRTPQGFTEVGSLQQQQLYTRNRLPPASIAMALSKVPELYKVRLARVRTVTHRSADWRAIRHAADEAQGGGYEFQLLDGQQRARRNEEQLAASAVVLESVPTRYAYGTEGIVNLLAGIDRGLVNPRSLLGIGRISATTSDTGHADPHPMRHVVVVFDSEETARSLLTTMSRGTSTMGKDSTSAEKYLIQRGCKARSIHDLQILRTEYLEHQNNARRALDCAQESQTPAPPDTCSITIATEPQEPVNAPYPLECLIYLQNLPDNTNKTEIKAKLDVFLDGGKVDYVDWKKGQISAHVRVVQPAHARKIIEGLSNEPGEASMKAELLKGGREEMYWMKLPDKASTWTAGCLRCTLIRVTFYQIRIAALQAHA
ncbi:hypothetical protein NliqN6_1792 [Naganishia liquefaciens]|uniref:XRRM domain-containing protein n=1 Tax=Naganishia liquefaciens TaxID=104408 RepID=A0A8H3YDF9_9TREE|nr:hypothetical protein NliqN6_1792 [Naganishia liquefaciens]